MREKVTIKALPVTVEEIQNNGKLEAQKESSEIEKDKVKDQQQQQQQQQKQDQQQKQQHELLLEQPCLPQVLEIQEPETQLEHLQLQQHLSQKPEDLQQDQQQGQQDQQEVHKEPEQEKTLQTLLEKPQEQVPLQAEVTIEPLQTLQQVQDQANQEQFVEVQLQPTPHLVQLLEHVVEVHQTESDQILPAPQPAQEQDQVLASKEDKLESNLTSQDIDVVKSAGLVEAIQSTGKESADLVNKASENSVTIENIEQNKSEKQQVTAVEIVAQEVISIHCVNKIEEKPEEQNPDNNIDVIPDEVITGNVIPDDVTLANKEDQQHPNPMNQAESTNPMQLDIKSNLAKNGQAACVETTDVQSVEMEPTKPSKSKDSKNIVTDQVKLLSQIEEETSKCVEIDQVTLSKLQEQAKSNSVEMERVTLTGPDETDQVQLDSIECMPETEPVLPPIVCLRRALKNRDSKRERNSKRVSFDPLTLLVKIKNW